MIDMRGGLLVRALTGLLLLGAAHASSGVENTGYLFDGAIRTAGAEHGDFIVDGFNRLYVQAHPGATFAAPLSGTSSAIPWLTYGKVLFALMGRTATRQEADAYRAATGALPLEIRIAHTSDNATEDLSYSLGIYVNRANPIENLTPDQVAKMLSVGNGGGDYSRWGQLGLTGAWAQRAIHPYGTPEWTGMGVYMQTTQIGGRPFPAAYEQHGSTAEILARLVDDPAGIAFAGIGRGNERLKQVAIVPVDGGPPMRGSRDDVASGRYPYGRYLYVYVRRVAGEPLDPVAVAYLRLVLSPAGQTVIASQKGGYIPLTDQERHDELEKLK